ncbi:MAG: carotenoid biosynthesis protein [Nodosilinea sp. LVE1205-7]|jgi:putative membrane protein
MRYLLTIERFCLYGHLIAMAFGLAGLLWVVPHPEILSLLPAGPRLFEWSMAGGGVGYILLGATAVGLYGYRSLGARGVASFALTAIAISLASELLGTSTGFPFGHYSYLNGLGYKIAGLVPFTIPLSWFYLGLCSLLLARSGLGVSDSKSWLHALTALGLGSMLLTSWDFVLDPAMSQTSLPFWYWHQPGDFFGMPYQNFAGWLGTGFLFMAVGTAIWRLLKVKPESSGQSLNLPLVVYLGNFAFALVMSLAAGFYIPIAMGMITGAVPALVCWWLSRRTSIVASASVLSPEPSLSALESSLPEAGVVLK